MTVSFIVVGGGPLKAEQVSQFSAKHKTGQTFLTWKEVDPPVTQNAIPVRELKEIQAHLEQEKRIRYRIYRSQRPITSIEGSKFIAEVPPLTCWNVDYYGVHPQPEDNALRYVIEEGMEPVAPGTGVYVHNPQGTETAYYAITVSINGKENISISKENALQMPLNESVGQGVPVLQRIVNPQSFNYIENPKLYYYVRWEAPPTSNVPSKPYDYVVAIPPSLAKPAPVGIHLHSWGANLNGGYGWWFNAEKGAILIASNQIPYDWWTGYHELLGTVHPLRTKADWTQGVVRPYSQRRLLAFLDWVATQWEVDLTRTFVAGNSMGGSGALMLAFRFPERIAWAISWVGVHVPSMSPTFKSSYALVYGEPELGVQFEDGTPVWDFFNDASFLRQYPDKEVGFVIFSNGKNDNGIGWTQAVEFYRALQETRRPHLFVWGQGGHGQRAIMPGGGGGAIREREMPIDIRTDQSLPAFTHCSLDDNPGSGDPADGDPEGQVNAYLYWETRDIVDQTGRWEITVRLIDDAPRDTATVDITPRRWQKFKAQSSEKLKWTNVSFESNKIIQSGEVVADKWGLITLEKVVVGKGKNRITVVK